MWTNVEKSRHKVVQNVNVAFRGKWLHNAISCVYFGLLDSDVTFD